MLRKSDSLARTADEAAPARDSHIVEGVLDLYGVLGAGGDTLLDSIMIADGGLAEASPFFDADAVDRADSALRDTREDTSEPTTSLAVEYSEPDPWPPYEVEFDVMWEEPEPYFPFIHGDDSDNTLEGDDGMDNIFGHGGDDTLYGHGERDVLHGGSGVDTLFGGEGDDVLIGGAQSDVYYGGAGDDDICDDQGDDVMWGDEGADSFHFNTIDFNGIGGGYDVIKDFELGVDKLKIINLDASYDKSFGEYVFDHAFGNADPGVTIQWEGGVIRLAGISKGDLNPFDIIIENWAQSGGMGAEGFDPGMTAGREVQPDLLTADFDLMS